MSEQGNTAPPEAVEQQQANMDELSRTMAEVAQQHVDKRAAELEQGYVQTMAEGSDAYPEDHELHSDAGVLVDELYESRANTDVDTVDAEISALEKKLDNPVLRSDERKQLEEELQGWEGMKTELKDEWQKNVEDFRDDLSVAAQVKAWDEVDKRLDPANVDEYWNTSNASIENEKKSKAVAAKADPADSGDKPAKPGDSDKPKPDDTDDKGADKPDEPKKGDDKKTDTEEPSGDESTDKPDETEKSEKQLYHEHLEGLDGDGLKKELDDKVQEVLQATLDGDTEAMTEHWSKVQAILDHLVASGEMTQSEAIEKIQEITEHITEEVAKATDEDEDEPDDEELSDLEQYKKDLEEMSNDELKEELSGTIKNTIDHILDEGGVDLKEYWEDIGAILDQMVTNGMITQDERRDHLEQIKSHIVEQVKKARSEEDDDDEPDKPDDDEPKPDDDEPTPDDTEDDTDAERAKEEAFLATLDPKDQEGLRLWMANKRKGEATDPSFADIKAEYLTELRREGGKISSKLIEAFVHRKGYTPEAVAEEKWWRTRVAKFEGWYDTDNEATKLFIENAPRAERVGRSDEEWEEKINEMKPFQNLEWAAEQARWMGDKRAYREFMGEAYKRLSRRYIAHAHDLLGSNPEAAAELKRTIYAVALARMRLTDRKLVELPKARKIQIDTLIEDGIEGYDEAKEVEVVKTRAQKIADQILARRKASDHYEPAGKLSQGSGAIGRVLSGRKGAARERLLGDNEGEGARKKLRRAGRYVLNGLVSDTENAKRYVDTYDSWAAGRLHDPALTYLSAEEKEQRLRDEFDDYLKNYDKSLQEPS